MTLYDQRSLASPNDNAGSRHTAYPPAFKLGVDHPLFIGGGDVFRADKATQKVSGFTPDAFRRQRAGASCAEKRRYNQKTFHGGIVTRLGASTQGDAR